MALRNLRGAGFVNYEPCGVISLTDRRSSETRRLSETRRVFRKFFITILGTDQGDADETACRLEHAMAPEFMARFLEFMKFTSSVGKQESNWKSLVEEFCIDNGVSPGNLATPVDIRPKMRFGGKTSQDRAQKAQRTAEVHEHFEHRFNFRIRAEDRFSTA